MCKIKWVDVPILYEKSAENYNRIVHATKYPSLTNGLILGDRYFVIEVENKNIERSFENSLQKISLRVIWLPLKKALHTKGVVDGFLH